MLTEERDRERVIRIKLPFQKQAETTPISDDFAASRQPWCHCVPNLLSLDAPIVALAWQYLLGVSFKARPKPIGLGAQGSP